MIPIHSIHKVYLAKVCETSSLYTKEEKEAQKCLGSLNSTVRSIAFVSSNQIQIQPNFRTWLPSICESGELKKHIHPVFNTQWKDRQSTKSAHDYASIIDRWTGKSGASFKIIFKPSQIPLCFKDLKEASAGFQLPFQALALPPELFLWHPSFIMNTGPCLCLSMGLLPDYGIWRL